MMKNHVKLWAVFALMVLFFAACQKDNTAEQLEEQHRQQQQLKAQRFLTLPPEPDTCLVRIAAELSKINNERTTLPHFADMFGYPKWQHAQIFETNGILNCFVPLGNDSKQRVGAILHTYFSTDGNRLAFVLITKSNINEVIAAMPDNANKPSRVMYKAFFAMHQNTVYGLGGQTEVLLEVEGDKSYYYSTARTSQKKILCKIGYDELCTWEKITYGACEGDWLYCRCIEIFGSSTSPLTNNGIGNNNFPSVFDSPGGGGGGGNGVDSGYDDLWSDWGNSSGGGSGGFIDDDPPVTGGGSGTPLPEQPKPEPFDQEKFLNEDLNKNGNRFATRMKEVLDSTKKYGVEYGVQIQKKVNGTTGSVTYYPLPFIRGEDAKVDLPIRNFKLAGEMHTHNAGRGPIFSFGDFIALALTLIDQPNEGINQFFSGVVTVDGDNAYILMVEDEAAYTYWRDRYIMWKTQDFLRGRQAEFEKEYDTFDPQKCEAEFVRYLKEKKTGLRLYKGNTKDFSTWEKIK